MSARGHQLPLGAVPNTTAASPVRLNEQSLDDKREVACVPKAAVRQSQLK
jgi:hypothetical protein